MRLPNTAFKALAGTEVTADILFLQKREHILDQDVSWLHTGTNADGIPMNQYFIDHPEMICGKMEMVSGPYGMRPTCQPDTSTTLEEQLQAAMGRLNATLVKAEPVILEQQPEEAATLPADTDVRNYSYCIRDDRIFFRTDSVMREVIVNATAQARIKGMVSILATTRELIQAQLDDLPDETIAQLQRRLNQEYDAYTEKHGRLSSRANALAMREDSGYSLLCSLEIYDDDRNFKAKSDMFTKRTIRPNQVIDHVETASEALMLSVQECTSVDLSYMEQLTGKPRDELLQELTGVVFRVPGETTAAGEPLYQTGEEYLSGDVRKKLATAEIFAQQDPSYQVNVDSLRGVQPKDLTASEIELHLGTTWIPPEDIKQFILETMEPNRWAAQSIKVSYNRLNATWNIEGSSVDSYSLKATTTFGTKRKNFYEILRCSLNLQAVKVVDYIEDVDGKKKAVPNVKETRLAQDKQQQIETAFKDWIYRDPVRRRRLVDYYNTHYNNLRPREYDGSFLRFPGMSPEISLRPHQRNVVARILFGGNTLVAHAVGAGKTMVMGVAAMEKKRLGLCNKTLIIVPNHLTEQMGSELLSLYPNANILVATKRDFEKDRRKLFCSRIATGNYDIVIMGHSQFTRIPLSIERQQQFLQDEIERYTQEIASAKKEKSGQDLSVKQMEATKKRLQSHLEELMDSPKDDVVTFEQLGIDSLMVDEAHEFKNLAVTTKMQNVAGISTSESQKATDLLMKCQYLDEITGGRGLVFCTGTPISNSPVELYTMMRYLQASTLRAHDLLSFDAWAANFGQTTTSIELAPEGTGYRSKTRFSRFFNLPELISMWKLATDVQTSDMLNLKVPDLEGGKATAVMCPPTELQKESIQALGERAEKVRAGNVDPHTDNMLKITTDGRKLALDQRLLNPLLPDVPENKATACASKVFEIWQNTMATQSTQLIFSDLATPSTGEWNVYDDIRDKLIAKGIPKEQIAFIHDANTDAKKATLFAKVRAGKVRILMGSTQKMGAGTNVQTKLIALHHLDVPWRPSDIEQREGRILRQGNENPSVQIYRYATEGSFDAYSWQLIENKQKFISQIMTSKSPARSCQDLDEVALSYAEIKALCAGNPLIKEKMELDNEVARLSTLRSSHMSQIFELQDKIAIGYPASIQKVEESLDAVSKDIDVYRANSRFNPDGSEKFSAIVMGTTYTERKAADAALRDALQGATAGDVIIGQYRGFNIHAYYDAKAVSFMGYLQGEQKYNFEFNPKENFSSFRHLLEKLSDTQALDQERLTILNKNLEDAKEAVNQPFAYEKEFQTKLASAIIGNTGSVNSGDSSEYFNETARGLITGLVLLVSQYGQDGERHIVSVFNLIVELAGADNPEKGNTVQKSRLAAMLEGVTDRRIKGYISTTTSADIRTTLNIVSSALSKLLKFVDAELEQLICTHDNDLDAEQFIERPTAIFLIAPDENETRHFLASLFVRFLTDDLIALAERQGGHCPRPFYYFLDEFGNFPAIPGVTSLFSAIRSRGGRILVAVQSYSQFLLKYDKNVTEIIKDNCQILLNTFVSPSAQDTATSISKMLGDETILTGSSSRSDGKTTSSHQLMGRPLMSPAQMVRIQRDTWIVEKAGYAPMKTHLEGYWKYLSLAPQEQDSTGENDYLEIKLLSTESLRQALGSAPARPHAPSAATREPRRKLGASRREAAALYPGKFNP